MLTAICLVGGLALAIFGLIWTFAVNFDSRGERFGIFGPLAIIGGLGLIYYAGSL